LNVGSNPSDIFAEKLAWLDEVVAAQRISPEKK